MGILFCTVVFFRFRDLVCLLLGTAHQMASSSSVDKEGQATDDERAGFRVKDSRHNCGGGVLWTLVKNVGRLRSKRWRAMRDDNCSSVFPNMIRKLQWKNNGQIDNGKTYRIRMILQMIARNKTVGD